MYVKWMAAAASTTVRVRRGRPPKLDLEVVVEAAVTIADQDGLDAVTLRSVARQLQVSAMSLYTYVPSVEHLTDLVVARVIGRQARTVRWPKRWDDIVRVFCRELRDLLAQHPAILESYQRRTVYSESALEAAEVVLSALRAAGLDLADAVSAYGAAHAFVIGHASLAAGQRQSARSNNRSTGGEPTPLVDVSRFPTLVAARAHLAGYSQQPENFDQAVDWLIAGIRTSLAGRA